MKEHIHFIGIGGAGMSGIARILARQGVLISGSDLRESEVLESLRQEFGIHAIAGHAPGNIDGATLIVASAAVHDDNPEMIAALAQGVPVISRAQMLGQLMARYEQSVGITGTHGKTTTTGMTASVLEAGRLDPTVLIGGDLPAYGGNARLGASSVFAAEACEAYDSFLDLHPKIAVITNIEADHLDYYGTLENVLKSFRQYLTQTSGAAILYGSDVNIQKIIVDPAGLPEIITYSLEQSATLWASDIELDGLSPSYTAHYRGETLGRLALGVPGLHNVINSLAVVAVGLQLGMAFEDIVIGLGNFTGTGRRFERLGTTHGGALVIDDYAHHPTEIRATLAAARRAYPTQRIVVMFQPHLPSRTSDFKHEFAASFGDADLVVLTDIYLAREKPIEGVTGAGLAELTVEQRGSEHVTYVGDKEAVAARLEELTLPGDVVLCLGAGHDVRTIAEAFLAGSKKKELL